MNVQNPTFSLLNLTLRLGVIAAVAAVLLTIVNQLTLPAREAARASVEQSSLKTVLPPYKSVGTPILKDNCTFYPAFNDKNELIAFAAKGKGVGYGGEMTVMFGLMLDGTIGIVDVVSQNETPGLGTIESVRTREKTIFTLGAPTPKGIPPNKYLDQFNCKKLPLNYQPNATCAKCNIEFKTGATVTMQGLTDAIYGTTEVFMKNKLYLENQAQKQKGGNQ